MARRGIACGLWRGEARRDLVSIRARFETNVSRRGLVLRRGHEAFEARGRGEGLRRGLEAKGRGEGSRPGEARTRGEAKEIGEGNRRGEVRVPGVTRGRSEGPRRG
jgi:hypothetical protein